MKLAFTYWRTVDGFYLGYLHDYPDHWTQGENYQDLLEHLYDLFLLFQDESIPGIKKNWCFRDSR